MPETLSKQERLALNIAVGLLIWAAISLFWYQITTSMTISWANSKIEDVEKKIIDRGTYSDNEGIILVNQQYRLKMLATAKLAEAGIGLNICGSILGLALSFLGFSMLLLQFRESIDAKLSSESVKVSLRQLSPGSLCVICGTVIIVVALIWRPTLDMVGDNITLKTSYQTTVPSWEKIPAPPRSHNDE